ncbi:MAG: LysR family transcriptional regulator [Caulobacteraceae bacterium]|nr:LysR family transcriptional regulator [Caulobacteraceae bacterium]
MHLASIDLNLLRVFDVLLEERSVTRAGVRLGLTQSAVSHALNRLRYHLDDDLFQRNAHGMQPTPRALEIGPNLHAALAQLQSALTPADFDPAVSERAFSIVGGSYVCAVLLPQLVAELQVSAPRVQLQIRDSLADLAERMDSGAVDFVIGIVDQAPERFVRERLIQERLAWVVRREHPLANSQASLEDLLSIQHVVVAAPPEVDRRRAISLRAAWEDFGELQGELARRGLSRRVGVVAPDTFAATAIVARSEMAALIPRRLALLLSQSGRLAVLEPPYESSPVEMSLLYRKDRIHEPPVAWMRGLLRQAAEAT